MMKEKFALISVYNKNGLENLCSSFFKNDIKIISTGSTAKHILSLGFPCKSVSSVTKFNASNSRSRQYNETFQREKKRGRCQ